MSAQLEIERKFIIIKPDIEVVSEMPDYTKSDIVQIYLDSPRGITHRVRSRYYNGRTEYTETSKIRLDKMSAEEREASITAERFAELSKRIALGTAPIIKTRHTFVYKAHTFEIDIYPDWQSTCILEVELGSRDEKIDFPDLISPVLEVTGDKKYTNASMARSFPPEI